MDIKKSQLSIMSRRSGPSSYASSLSNFKSANCFSSWFLNAFEFFEEFTVFVVFLLPVKDSSSS